MESTIQKILSAITERVATIIGSTIGSAASTYQTLYEAEQQSLLEDIAAQYDADGKHELAANLRKRALRINAEVPLATTTSAVEASKRLCDEARTRQTPKLQNAKPTQKGRKPVKNIAEQADSGLEDLQ